MSIRRVKLTIALQTHNRCRDGYLQQMLESILGQSYSDFELLIMDNHSTDSTADLIRKYDDDRLTYVRQPSGGSATSNITRAVWFARGKYVIPTHDDDIMEPEMIGEQMAFLSKHPDIICAASNVSLINEAGKEIQSALYEMNDNLVFEPGEYLPIYLKKKLWLPTPTMMFLRKAYLGCFPNLVRMVNPAYFPSGDIWSCILFNLRGPIALLAEPLLRYRQHSDQESRNVDQSEPLIHLVRLLIRYRRHHPLLKDHWPSIFGAYARFKTQDLLFKEGKNPESRSFLSGLRKITGHWKQNVPETDRAVDEVLPLEILLQELGQGWTIPGKYFLNLQSNQTESGAQAGYRGWLLKNRSGISLFTGKTEMKRIAVFGSMLTAFLIVLHAGNRGITVDCCFDSSPRRIGKSVWNVPVVRLTELRDREHLLDAVILSSERDHETALKEILREHCSDGLPIVSWKELVQ